MATDLTRDITQPSPAIPPELKHGARMDQKMFHRLYEQTPEGFKAELIGGVVYIDGEDGMASPLKASHGSLHALLMGWLTNYCAATPGTDLLDNATVILADDGEPQPDAVLRIENGASAVNAEGYVTGTPELVAEVSDTTVTRDLVTKRADYERHAIAEYLVFVLPEQRVVWFVRGEHGGYVELAPDPDGLLKSQVFPGLWLDPKAFFERDRSQVLDAVKRGTASPEHTASVESLSKRR